jgi:hypothetical protein
VGGKNSLRYIYQRCIDLVSDQEDALRPLDPLAYCRATAYQVRDKKSTNRIYYIE